MPYIQMHVDSTKRHCGDIVQFVHQASTKVGPFGLNSQSRRLCRGTVWSISCSNGLVKPRAPRYTPVQLVCSMTVEGVRYS